MGLSATRLRDAIKTNMQAKVANYTSVIGDGMDDFWEALAEAVVDEFTDNAEVAVDSVTGVQSGVDSSGSGTGTIS